MSYVYTIACSSHAQVRYYEPWSPLIGYEGEGFSIPGLFFTYLPALFELPRKGHIKITCKLSFKGV